MRYLIYHIDKHQSDCGFSDMLYDVDYQNADACLSVLVDLVEKRRYFAGEWKPCDARGGTTPPGVLDRGLLAKVAEKALEQYLFDLTLMALREQQAHGDGHLYKQVVAYVEQVPLEEKAKGLRPARLDFPRGREYTVLEKNEQAGE